MTSIVTTAANYLIIIIFAVYTYLGFHVFKKKTEEERRHIYRIQALSVFAISFLAYTVLYLHTESLELLLYYGAQTMFFLAVLIAFPMIYKNCSRLLLNHLCMLMSVGFFMIARLDLERSVRQFLIAVAGVLISIFVPVMINKAKFLKKWTAFYGLFGFALLAAVFLLGSVTGGSKINVTVHGITLAPSEFVKILFVFFIAGMLHKNTSFRRVAVTTLCAAAHVLILVLSRDLGGALILFVVYMSMLYAATKKFSYVGAGLFCFSGAAVAAFYLFSHVRIRVLTWTTDFDVLKNDSSQVSQSLFAIGTGSWFGSGFCQGLPETIPVAVSDFIFAAICEEFGIVFAICLILVCFSCFLMFVNSSLQIKDNFYKLVSFGLSVSFIFQVFLTIGGDSKFIPLTGVTLPLVSYGGSSVLSSVIVFAIIQGLYIMKRSEGEVHE